MTYLDDEKITVAISIFGRPVEYGFNLETAAEHLEPYSNLQPQMEIEEPLVHAEPLRRRHSGAEEIYASRFHGPYYVSGTVEMSRTGDRVKVLIHRRNMTWPLVEGDNYRTTEKDSSTKEWNALRLLIEQAGFWGLPHDDGVRHTTAQSAKHIHLQAWNGERYHSVIRQTLNDQCELSSVCDFLERFVPNEDWA